MLAKIANENAPIQNEYGALAFFASKLAPTERRINPPLTPLCLNHSLCVNLRPLAQPNKGNRK
ncbi:hypothetical protein CI807_00635 [Pseudomonas sp. NS1(2017)]|nr:hypothetical protein CI807_00635 [Pseudomonas sp. NS1(2017)]